MRKKKINPKKIKKTKNLQEPILKLEEEKVERRTINFR